jgi:hypothetical protein
MQRLRWTGLSGWRKGAPVSFVISHLEVVTPTGLRELRRSVFTDEHLQGDISMPVKQSAEQTGPSPLCHPFATFTPFRFEVLSERAVG